MMELTDGRGQQGGEVGVDGGGGAASMFLYAKMNTSNRLQPWCVHCTATTVPYLRRFARAHN